ncbi:hypothetical protein [Niabella ginsengisoli]|uniref:Uncharacterized protein n=1 Tax=Niabella ginsengisoli TaxID=522298 RepID=A0ABS9SRD2_9BACT|nr:hypothetical protein [Niabella ginsengisoli]MCH5600931.1 hypothetical protein [Niabella ginsengisoli]
MKSKLNLLVCSLMLFALNFQGVKLNAQCAASSSTSTISGTTMSFPTSPTYLYNNNSATSPITTPIDGLTFTTTKVHTSGTGGIKWTSGLDLNLESLSNGTTGGNTYRGETITFNKPYEKFYLYIGNFAMSSGGSEEAVITAYDINGNPVRYTSFTPDAGSYAAATRVTNSGTNNATTKIDGGNNPSDPGTARVTFYFEAAISKITLSVRNTAPDRNGSGFVRFRGGCAVATSLPVNFGNVIAEIKGNALNVNWQTLTEKSNDHFEIEVSKDGKSWSKAGSNISSKAAEGNSDLSIQYEQSIPLSGMAVMGASIFLLSMGMMFRRNKWLGSVLMIVGMSAVLYGCTKNDNDISATAEKVYVRIKQVDKDGTASYSKVVTAVVK